MAEQLTRIFTNFIRPVYAHCDTLDGPVVNAARKAISSGNVNLALIWVDPKSELSVKQAYNQTLVKRDYAADESAKAQADYAFFEHFVKAHREGEGVAYEGLKAVGADAEERMADRAVASSNLDEILPRISSDHSKHVVTHMFHYLLEKSDYKTDDLPAGREYVAAYANFVHAVGPAIKGQDLSEHSHHTH